MTTTPKSRRSILVVEDDPETSRILQIYFENAGARVHVARDGVAGLRSARALLPDLVVLDLMLPGLDGWEVCRQLRDESDVPILILSARQEESDRLLGLGLGADDYVIKPFSPREVVLRAEAILRRTGSRAAANEAPPERLGKGALQLDPAKRLAIVSGTEIELTPSEYKILFALMRRPGRTLDRDDLLGQLYPSGGSAVPKAIDVHMRNLRQKLEADPAHPRYLRTVRGFGYRFVEPS